MSKYQLTQKLKALNNKIDNLILSGKSYEKEAKEHRFIVHILSHS